MANLIYSAVVSLDGYIEDQQGSFNFAEPDEEVHRVINERERQNGTYLFGRRMYEVMVVWEDPRFVEGLPAYIGEYAEVWKAADKIVYSTTLESVTSARTRIEREFDVEAVRRMKERATARISIGGPTLAAHAFAAGLVDECHLFVAPVVVGGGKPALPDGVRMNLRLLEERRFNNGFVLLHYGVEG